MDIWGKCWLRAGDRKSKYVAVTHNDVVTGPSYLREDVGYMVSHRNIGAAQGIVKRLGTPKIDSVGFMLDEALNFHTCESTSFTPKKPFTFPMLKAQCHSTVYKRYTQAKNENEIFVPGAFMYYLEDVLFLLNFGAKDTNVSFSHLTGEHQRTATSKPENPWTILLLPH